MSNPFIRTQIYSIPEVEYQPSDTPDNQTLLVIHPPLANPESELLQKILGATKLDPSFISTVEAADNINCYSSLLKSGHKKNIIFGFKPQDIWPNISAKPFQILNVNGRSFVFSEPLKIIAKNQTSKKHLWQAMTSMLSEGS